MRLDFPHYPAKLLCRALGVSRSGFYDWLHARPSARMQEDARLKVLITAVHRQTRETYGVPRIKSELAAQGHEVGRDTGFVGCARSSICAVSSVVNSSPRRTPSMTCQWLKTCLDNVLSRHGPTKHG